MLAQRDEAGAPVFPPGGTRVLAYPAPHFARWRRRPSGDYCASPTSTCAWAAAAARPVQQARRRGAAGRGASAHFEPLFEPALHLGVTLQIDEGAEVFDAKHSTLHPLFNEAG